MNVISRKGLLEQSERHPEALRPLATWYAIVRRAKWTKFEEVRSTFSTADRVGRVLIFNVMGNRYRLITTVDAQFKRLYIKALLTHAEYGRREWKKWV